MNEILWKFFPPREVRELKLRIQRITRQFLFELQYQGLGWVRFLTEIERDASRLASNVRQTRRFLYEDNVPLEHLALTHVVNTISKYLSSSDIFNPVGLPTDETIDLKIALRAVVQQMLEKGYVQPSVAQEFLSEIDAKTLGKFQF